MNIFERAARKKLRFDTVRGYTTTEQLFDLPLTSNDGFNLDEVAKLVAREIRDADDESFVAVAVDPQKRDNELRLEIIKYVIAAKKTAAEAAQTRAARQERRHKLEEALARKQDAALAEMTEDELAAAIAEVNGDEGA